MGRLNPCPVCGCEAISQFRKVVPLQFAYEHCGICGGYRNDWKAARIAWNKTTAEWILEKEGTKVDRHTATECAYKNGFAAGMKAAEEKIVRGHHIGDFCIYSFDNENKSLAIVEIVKILNDERGVAEVKFHKVIVDDTGNGFFTYLNNTGQTMNASLCYLKNITPSGERRSDG